MANRETLLRFVDERAKQPLYDLRAVGSMTSKSLCYQTTGTQLSLSALDYIEMVGEHRVRAGAGVVLKSLIDFLNERQLALPTIGEWSGQTLGGAIQLNPRRLVSIRLATPSIVSRCSTEPATRSATRGPSFSPHSSFGTTGIILEFELNVVLTFGVAPGDAA